MNDWRLSGSNSRFCSHGMDKYMPPPPQKIRKPDFREGYGYATSEIADRISRGGWAWALFARNTTEKGTFMEVEQAASKAADSVGKVADSYRKHVAELKSLLQNDSASIKASSERIEKEFARVAASVSNVSAVLTSPKFAEALSNAERLAAALSAIQSLGSGSIAFHVQGATDSDE